MYRSGFATSGNKIHKGNDGLLETVGLMARGFELANSGILSARRRGPSVAIVRPTPLRRPLLSSPFANRGFSLTLTLTLRYDFVSWAFWCLPLRKTAHSSFLGDYWNPLVPGVHITRRVCSSSASFCGFVSFLSMGGTVSLGLCPLFASVSAMS